VLLTVTIHDLRPDDSTFYLANIHQALTDTSRSDVVTVTPRASVDTPSTFSPSKYAIWVNALWFLSLSISLSCALIATLINQWARRYVKITQSRYSPLKRARTRSFFAEGVDKLHLPLAVEALSALVHSSLFLFFMGLAVFLYNVESIIFKVWALWFGSCALLYTCFTFLPILRHDSPYYTPLSPLVWFLYTGLLCVIFQSLQWLTAFNYFYRARWERFRALRDQHHAWFSHGIEKTAKDFALKVPPDVDGRMLIRMLEKLDEDDEVEVFFGGIPKFCNSAIVSDPRSAFKTPNGEKISEALFEFMCHTLSSNLVPEPVKQRRIEICNKAVVAASLPIDRHIFDRVLYKDWGGLLNSVEFGHFLRGITYCDPFTAYYSQCVISVILARVQERDSRWLNLAVGQLGVSETVLRNYLDHGDSLLLAICISTCRRTMRAYSEHGWNRDAYSRSKTLESLSQLDVRHTLPELRNHFCTLWNELVDSARCASDHRTRSLSINILMHIRNTYIVLHESTSSAPTQFSITTADNDPILVLPFSYPFCNIPAHSQDLPHHVDKTATNATGLNAYASEVTLPMNPDHIDMRVAGEPPPDHVRA
jgi:hypothetical protein